MIARRIEWACLIVGFLLAGWYFYNLASTKVVEVYENRKLEEEIAKAPEEEAKNAPRPARGELIGRIEIPRVSISAVIREGTDDRTLKRSAGHVSYTPLPGEKGNVGIAAHRDTHFRNLKGIRNGDRIRMVTPAGTYEYEVASLKIVKPENVEVLDPTPYKALTLVTCYPFNFVGSAPKRFIVQARQLSSEEPQTSERYSGSHSSRAGMKAPVRTTAASGT